MNAVYTRKDAREEILEVLPRRVSDEVRELLTSRARKFERAEEIRLRTSGRCSLVCSGREIPLFSSFDEEDSEELLQRLCHGSVYAYREQIADGYVTFGSGVRVGVAGEAKYEGGDLVGVRGVDSYVFRFPSSECDFIDRLYSSYVEMGGGSMLIASPPCCGKTTALKAMAKKLGCGKEAGRVVVVDERGEFVKEDYALGTVDILRGYKRSRGIEIALRTMSADYLLADELCTAEDFRAIETAFGTGVKIISTSHGDSLERLKKRRWMAEALESGVFDILAFIRREGDVFCAEAFKI